MSTTSFAAARALTHVGRLNGSDGLIEMGERDATEARKGAKS